MAGSTQGSTLKELRARMEQLTLETEELKAERRRVQEDSRETQGLLKELKREAHKLSSRRGFFSLVSDTVRAAFEFCKEHFGFAPLLIPLVIVPVVLAVAVGSGDCNSEPTSAVVAVGSALSSVSDGPPVGSRCDIRVEALSTYQCKLVLTCGAWTHESEYHCWENSYTTSGAEGSTHTHYYLVADGAGSLGEISFNEYQRLLTLTNEHVSTVIVMHSVKGRVQL